MEDFEKNISKEELENTTPIENEGETFEGEPVAEVSCVRAEVVITEEKVDAEVTTEPEVTPEPEQTAGWTYSAGTNQYKTLSGEDIPAENSVNEVVERYTAPRAGNRSAGIGTQYGYYSSQGVTPENTYVENNWNNSGYNMASTAENGRKKKKGAKVLLGLVAALLIIAVVGLAGVGVYSLATGGALPFGMSKISVTINNVPADAPPVEDETSIKENAPTLVLQDHPSEEETIPTGGKLSSTQIYKAVSPSIVGVMHYRFSKSMQPVTGGSGIVLTNDGYIVTNAHVVAGADAIKVVLYNGEEYEAKIIGEDEQTDIAVIKIDATNLTAAEFGDSNGVQVGDVVYACGNPGGLKLQGSFTNGIISGLNRVITTDASSYAMSVIQTNAAINPGNSGGALINEYGQVIGITSSKLMALEYEGISFAIPTAEAKGIIDDLIEKGFVQGRPIMGCMVSTVDEIAAKMYGVPTGVQITSINSQRNAFEDTRIVVGDIITAIDGKDIHDISDLQKYMQEYKPGDTVTLSLYRYFPTGKSDYSFTESIVLLEDEGTNDKDDEGYILP